jgi:hypothetical protein
MTLPIKSILWAPSNSAHYNHLHVEGDPRFTGTPPLGNPGMSPSVQVIYAALIDEFGMPAYMTGGDWTHMGWYNRRPIAGTNSWSQHSWANALDIGPYYGVEEQQRFYDFLTGQQLPQQEADMQRPSWFSQDMLDRLATQNIIPREDESEDMWRTLAFLDRHIQRGDTAGPHDHDGRYVKNVIVSR